MRIELCGGIGAGKTTLAIRLAKALDSEPVCENYNDVPYWEAFCHDYKTYEFEKNVGFLLLYGDLIRKHPKDSIFDFSFAQALGFVAMSNDKRAEEVLRQLVAFLLHREGAPDLVISVECGIEEQLRRIRLRARVTEVGIDRPYLEKLQNALDREAELFCSKKQIPLLRFASGPDGRGNSFEGLLAEVASYGSNSKT